MKMMDLTNRLKALFFKLLISSSLLFHFVACQQEIKTLPKSEVLPTPSREKIEEQKRQTKICQSLPKKSNEFWTSLPDEHLQFAIYKDKKALFQDPKSATLSYLPTKDLCFHIMNITSNELIGVLEDVKGSTTYYVRILQSYFEDKFTHWPKENSFVEDYYQQISKVKPLQQIQPTANCDSLTPKTKGFWMNLPLGESIEFAVYQTTEDALNRKNEKATLKTINDVSNRCLFVENYHQGEVLGKLTDKNGQNANAIRINESYFLGLLENSPKLSLVFAEQIEKIPSFTQAKHSIDAKQIATNAATQNSNPPNKQDYTDSLSHTSDLQNFEEISCIIDHTQSFKGNSLRKRRERAYAKFAYSEIANSLEQAMVNKKIQSKAEKAHFYSQILKETHGGFMKEGAGSFRNNTNQFYDKIFYANSDQLKDPKTICQAYDEEFTTQAIKKYYDLNTPYDFLFRGRGLIQLTGVTNYLSFFFWFLRTSQGLDADYVSNIQHIDSRMTNPGIHSGSVEKAQKFASEVARYFQGFDVDPFGIFKIIPVDSITKTNFMESTLDKLANPCKKHHVLNGANGQLTNTDFITKSAIYFWEHVRESNAEEIQSLNTESVWEVSRTIAGGISNKVVRDRLNHFINARKCIL